MVQKILTQLENLAYWFQRAYMKPKMTSERVGRHYAFFHPRPTGKIVMEEFKKRTQRILVTGCFDILHGEHKKLLKAAKKLGGRLLVGIEVDKRVKKLKGPGRPINPLVIRLENLRRLKLADEVFALPEKFDEHEDYEKFIAKLRPDILAVSESTPFMTNKKELMPKYGGRVVVVLKHNPKVSTTKMLKSEYGQQI